MTFFDILTPVIEISIIAVILNHLFYFFRKSGGLLIGLAAFFILFTLSTVLRLPVLYTIMANLMNIAAIGLLIIFQPELRAALSKLNFKTRRYQEVTEFDKFLDHLTNSVYHLADKRVGALIALTNSSELDEIAQRAVVLNAKFSPELLEAIFLSPTSLHDGAVVIRDKKTILAASVIFPLPDESAPVTRSMGTRHRAALGISQKTAALVIIVSEEKGKVSLSRDGILCADVKIDKFQGVLQSLYDAKETQAKERKSHRLRKWIPA